MISSVRIHSKVVLDHPCESALYYYLRAADKDGQGWIRYGLRGLKKLFSLSIESVKRLLYKGKSKNFFKEVEVSKSKETIYVKFNSLKEVKRQTGGCYASAVVPISTLYDRGKLKSTAYHIAFLRLQQDSEWRIDNQNVPKRNKFNLNEEKTRSNLQASGCCHYSSSSENYFLYGRINAPSASQITIASFLNKSRSTVVHWAKTIPHFHLFKRVRLNDPMPRHHFRCYQVTKNQRKRRLEYRRLPNQYSNSFSVRKEPKARFRPSERPFDPSLHLREQFEKEDLQQKLKVQKNPYTRLQEKLASLSLSKLQLLLDSYLSDLGYEFELEDITSLNREQVFSFLYSLSEEDRYKLYKLLIELLDQTPYSREEVSEEYLDWFYSKSSEPFSSPKVESTGIDLSHLSFKKTNGRNFKQNLDAIPKERVRQLAINFLEVIGKASKDLIDALKRASGKDLRSKLLNTLSMFSLKELKWLRLLTKRTLGGKLPANQQMKSGLIEPEDVSERTLKLYFKF